MRARGWVIAASLGLGVGSAAAQPERDPKPQVVEIAPLKDRMRVFQDADGGTYVVVDELTSDARAWYGTGKNLYEQVVTGRSRTGEAWSINTWAPRVPELRPGSITRKPDGTFHKQCGLEPDVGLTELGADQAKAAIARSAFLTSAMVRRPHLLARDDRGVYYYVDRLSEQHGGKGFRVLVGKKGALKQRPLLDVASDSAGQVFATRSGELRLVLTTEAANKPSVAWIKGPRRTNLIQLDLHVNSPLIFSELGVYKFTGTICDDI